MTAPTRKRRPPVEGEGWGSAMLAEWGLSPLQQKVLAGLGVVAGVLVTALLLTMFVDAIGSDAPTAATAGSPLGQARPVDYRAWPSLKQFDPIADRTADAKPFTAEEIFFAKTLKAGKVTLKLGPRQLDGSCEGVAWGETMIEALAEAGCTQAARAQFTSTDTHYVAQYTLLNLESAQAANTLVTKLASTYRGGWVLPLTTTEAFGRHSEASGFAMGHYVGLVWIARVDGAEPEPGDDFVSLSLAVREAEKAVYRRVVAKTGVPSSGAAG